MEFLASKYISTISIFFFFQFKLISRVNLPETGNNRRAPAWLIPESSWWSPWWWWWFREFWTGSAGCRVHGNSMTEESRIFRGNTLVGKGSRGSGSHENTRSLHNYLSKNRNPWLEIRKPLCSFHNERPCPPNGKAEGRRKGKFLISLSSEESNSLNNSPRIVTRTHREFKFSSTYIVSVEEIRRMEISAKSFQNIVQRIVVAFGREGSSRDR